MNGSDRFSLLYRIEKLKEILEKLCPDAHRLSLLYGNNLKKKRKKKRLEKL